MINPQNLSQLAIIYQNLPTSSEADSDRKIALLVMVKKKNGAQTKDVSDRSSGEILKR